VPEFSLTGIFCLVRSFKNRDPDPFLLFPVGTLLFPVSSSRVSALQGGHREKEGADGKKKEGDFVKGVMLGSLKG